MTKKVLLFTLFLLLTASIPFVFCCCSNQQADAEFIAFESGDVYTCQIDEQTSFWYSPEYVYGEWSRGDTVIPMKLSFYCMTEGVLSHAYITLYDEYCSPFAQIRLRVNLYKMTPEQCRCRLMYETKVFEPRYQTFVDEQLSDVDFEGIVIKKVKKEVECHESLFAPMLNFFSEAATYVLEGTDMWFVGTPTDEEYYNSNSIINKGPGYGENRSTGSIVSTYFEVGRSNGDRWKEHQTDPIKLTDTVNSYRYILLADAQGIYIRMTLNGEEQKVYIRKATPETDPQRDFWSFLEPEDENGNEYVFSCADGNFSYGGEAGEGIWEHETQQKQIYVGKNNYPLQLIIKEAGDEGKTLVTGTFVEMVDEHTAKFEINNEYLSNPLFADTLTEFYITKEIPEQ